MQRRLRLLHRMVLLFLEFLATRIFFQPSHGYAKSCQKGIHPFNTPQNPASARSPRLRCTGISLNGGFIVSDGQEPDTQILLKVRHPKEKAAEPRQEGYTEFVLVERMYFPDMKIYRNEDLPEKVIT